MVRLSSLYGRTVSLISVVFVGSFAVLALAFSAITSHRTRDAINDLQNCLLLASGSIRDFIITRDPVHAKRAELILTDANNVLHARLDEEDYDEFHSELHLYLHDVSNLIEAYQERGFYEGDGVEGRLRANLQSVEDQLIAVDNRELLSYLLQIRREEKNYLLRQDETYQDAVHADIDAMSLALQYSQLPSEQRSDIIASLADYQNDFDELVYLTQKGLWINDELRVVRDFLEEELEELVAREDRQAQTFLWIGLGVILVSFVFGILYAHFMARSIVKPLERIRNAARSLANGKTDEEFDCTEDGEVGELADAFSELSEQVKMRVKAQEELKKSKAELELYARELETAKEDLEKKANDLSELVEELEEARNVAEHTIMSKTLFLANMSHEIRTPLNGIIGMTSLLASEDLRHDQYEIVKVIHSSGESLLDIVNAILDYAKIEQGGVDLEKEAFDVVSCLEDALDMVSKQAADKNLDLSYRLPDNVPTRVVGDRSRLRQILINLLANAVKFTEKGEIHTRIKVVETTDTDLTLQFEVRDTGIGISASAMEYLFDPFRQADPSTTRKFGGTGLGLSIARHLAELMGGKMWLESEVGTGSTFFFTVRFAQDPDRTSHPSVERVAAGKRVLFVGTRPGFSKSICTMIAQRGGEVQPVETLKAAESALLTGTAFDLILINDGQGREPAVEQARLLHKMTPETPIVLIMDLGKRSIDPSVSSILSKPVKRETIHALFAEVKRSTPIYKLESTKPPKADRDATHNLKILLVEDNKMNQKVALKMLQKLGYSADLAENGMEAVERVSSVGYDVVFMDMMMPGMDGVEATRQIRSREDLARQPLIIAFTANATTEDRKVCLDAGMDDYVAKPVSSETFAILLERARRELRIRHGARLESPLGPSVA